jgi:UDP-N-acetylglucosamine 4,6-dehydratase
MQKSDSFSVLITGGTGSFGKACIRRLLNDYPNIERIVVFSRDELKQWEMQQDFPSYKYPQMRFFLGDVRDRDRLLRAFEGIDYVIHAAALKQVPAAEYNPIEFIHTNVIGAENVIQASIDCKVKKVVALSTDKAAAPINLYGATKLCSDKLFVAANNIIGKKETKFSVVRYGNVMGSRGSVIPFFLKRAKEGSTLPVTHPDMTRFNISLNDGIEMVLWAFTNAIGGEILVPKIPSYNILNLAEAIAPSLSYEIIGLRPGEKLHEEMITNSDSHSTLDLGHYYTILPSDDQLLKTYLDSPLNPKKVSPGFAYNSGNNTDNLTPIQIRELIKSHVDPSFQAI